MRSTAALHQNNMSTPQRIDLSRMPKCPARWDRMPVVPGGRLCEACDRTIVDLRGMTEQAIAELHAFSEEPVCGLYDPDRLRPPAAEEVRGRGMTGPALGLLGLLLAGRTEAQDTSPPPATEQLQAPADSATVLPDSAWSASAAVNDTVVYTGRILERLADGSEEPLAFALVALRGRRIGTQTDFDGRFRLVVPVDSLPEGSVELLYQHVGMTPMKVTVDRVDTDLDPVTVDPSADPLFFGVTIQEPAHKRVGNWFGNLFRKKER